MFRVAASVELESRQARENRTVLLTAAVGIVALIFNLIRVGRPSMWRDEVVTALMAERGPKGIFVLAGHMDLVHTPYYLTMWAWSVAFGTSEWSLRLPSVAAMAVAVAALFLLARRYTTTLGALIAAALFLVLPSTTRYAQEARSYAFIVAAVVISTLLLHVALESRRRGWWIAYAAALAVGALFSFMSLTIILAHLVLLWRRAPLRTASFAWFPGVFVGGLIAWFGSGQAQAVGWIPPADWKRLQDASMQLAGSQLTAMLFLAAVVALAVWMIGSHRWQDFGWLLIVAALPLLLWIAGHFASVFVVRYVLFAVPFYALIAAVVTTRVHIVAALAFLLAVALLSYPEQREVRSQLGHGDDFRTAQALIAGQARPGDAIIFDFTAIRTGFDYYNDRTPTIPLADPLNVSAEEDLTTFGNLSKPCTPDALGGIRRLWDVHVPGSPLVARTGQSICGTDLRLVGTTPHGSVLVSLYQR
ncbi:hypothetical protein FND50_24990 [Rhodococcus sp. WB9]|nr:hypothetical protein FND50_24990 [Rhodococcus sp. WB9]